MRMSTMLNRIVLSAAFLAVGACSEVLTLDVDAPGRIADGDLNTFDAIVGIVNGTSYDLTDGIDDGLQEIVIASGELFHAGSYAIREYNEGKLSQSPEDWDGEYGQMQQARWVAEDGIRRIAGILDPTQFERNALVAKQYLLAGYANRYLGEQQCTSTIDGGPEVQKSEHFARADTLFARAIAIGQAASQSDIVTAAYGGRASARAALGQWAQAASDAMQVPAGFQYDAVFSTTAGAVLNDLVDETTDRREFSVWGTQWEDVLDDPRVPWIIPLDNAGQVLRGQDGSTPFYQQKKWLTEDDDVALTKGTEMLMIRAEAALRDGDLAGMTARLNEARAFYGGGLQPLAQPATTADAWVIMRAERGATLWLEGRRLWDLHRWAADGGVISDPFSAGRETCFPISLEEQRVNPNLGGG